MKSKQLHTLVSSEAPSVTKCFKIQHNLRGEYRPPTKWHPSIPN